MVMRLRGISQQARFFSQLTNRVCLSNPLLRNHAAQTGEKPSLTKSGVVARVLRCEFVMVDSDHNGGHNEDEIDPT
jgi:hypothetical protein